jgi:hypothetical protein
VRDGVGGVEGGDCGSEGGGGGDGDAGEGSVCLIVSRVEEYWLMLAERGTKEWGRERRGERLSLLGFKLVGQDEICLPEDVLVGRQDIFVHVEPALVAHDGVEDCAGG